NVLLPPASPSQFGLRQTPAGTGQSLTVRDGGAVALLLSECVAVARWRNCDTAKTALRVSVGSLTLRATPAAAPFDRRRIEPALPPPSPTEPRAEARARAAASSATRTPHVAAPAAGPQSRADAPARVRASARAGPPREAPRPR